jgi:hypothetical protein
LQQYLDSIREVIRDPASGMLLSQYQGAWQLTIVRRSGSWRGAHGYGWILIEYRLGLGRWVTAFQPRSGLRELMSAKRTHRTWLRRPL